MKVNVTQLVVIGLFAVVAWLLLKPALQSVMAGNVTSTNPSGGATSTAPQDIFNSAVSLANSIFAAAKTPSQNQPSTL